MAFLSTSRYVEDQDTGVRIGKLRNDLSRYVSFTTYTVGLGERLDQIAVQMYGDPTRWWEIADINSELPYPDGIAAGTVIRIPMSS